LSEFCHIFCGGHYGRATSIDEAILIYGGEATKSKKAYVNLSKGEQTELMAFLESL